MSLKLGRRELISLGLFLLAFIPRVIYPTRIAVIPDQVRDYGEAINLLAGRSLPLLGIPSSIPRFSQGPSNVWFSALAFLISGISLSGPVIAAALITSLGAVMFYWLLRQELSEGIAVLVSLVYALSPQAIIQSRLPFYLFAIPVFLVAYLMALLRLKRKTRTAGFWAAFSYFLLFQWELATLPLLTLLPLGVYRNKLFKFQSLLPILAGCVLGLLPQILFDLTHRCVQLCGLVVWTFYRMAAVSGFDGRHGLTLFTLDFWNRVLSQLTNLIGFGSPVGLLIVAFLAIVGIVSGKSVFGLRHYAFWGTLFLFTGLVIHGEPSEAYFPPFVVLIPILSGYGLKAIWEKYGGH